MISTWDSADKAIEKTITDMCKKLERTHPDRPEYITLVKSIAELRSSLNAPIISNKE